MQLNKNHTFQTLKLLLKLSIIYISIVTLGYLGLVAAYSIPYDSVKDNIDSAYSHEEDESKFEYIELEDWYKWFVCYYRQDWLGMSTMLSIIANVHLENKYQEVEVNPWTDSLLNKYISNKDYTGYYNLNASEEKEPYDGEYFRYWHGYVTILKPLFVLFNFQTIRILNIMFQSIMIFLICLLMHKRKLKNYIIAFLLTCLLLLTPLTGLSFQLSNSINIMLIATAILLWKFDKLKKNKRILLFFFTIGAIVNYFDFLTYPIITFGIPYTFILLIEDNFKLKENIKELIIYLAFWFMGYAMFWITKWVLCAIVLNNNVVDTVLARINDWGIGGNSSYWRSNDVRYSLSTNLSGLILQFIFSIPYIIFIAVWILYGFNKFENWKKDINIKKIIIFVLISIIPLIWLTLLVNHAGVHYRFTYRNLSISVFAITCLLLSINNPFHFKDIEVSK